LNIWSAGCSNGAEPYSVAILLRELSPGVNHRIFATDLDETVLEQAAAGGPYSASDVANVRPEYLLKYFTKTSKGYHVIDKLKNNIEFRRHNMLSEPFRQGFDMVICRNVVIYFSDDAKRGLFPGFHNSLRENGVLFIGATESLLGLTDTGFERMHNCFYRKAVFGKKSLSGIVAGHAVR
jgi:chemotaxis protein methyltransferase CheR